MMIPMTDPWAEVRKRLIRAKETEAAFPADDLDKFVSSGAQQATSDVSRLLTDADALLAVVRATNQYRNIIGDTVAMGEEVDRLLAALPERLK